MKAYVSIIDKMDFVVMQLIKVLTAELICTVVTQVVCRYTGIASLPWLEELARYTLVWITFLGTSIGIRRGSLMNVDAFLKIMPKKMAKVIFAVAQVFSMIFIILIIICGVQLFQLGFLQKAPSSGVKMCYVFAAFPAGGILMLLNFFAVFFEGLQKEGNR